MDALIGDWTTQSFVDGTLVGECLTSISCSGDGFVVLRAELEGPPPADVPREWIENLPFPTTMVIGADDARDDRTALYADGRGVRRVYSTTFDGRTWRIWRDAPGFNQRFEATLADDGTTITGAWEMSEDGESWRKDFDLVYRKR